MTPQDSRRLNHLFTLADLAIDCPTIDIKFCSYYESLREELGLAKLLLLIKEFVEAGKPTE
jgi:hypothetical protein